MDRTLLFDYTGSELIDTFAAGYALRLPDASLALRSSGRPADTNFWAPLHPRPQTLTS
jgi:hypothetical protein